MNHCVEIIVIGHELLLGDVQDTNTNWLCQQITALGGHVTRAAMIRDEVEAIANEIRAALDRRPALLMLSGGLGATDDDLTLHAVAQALNVELLLDSAALRLVANAFEKFAQAGHLTSAELTDVRRKMAFLPAGSQPLDNPVGAAPGVLVRNVGRSPVLPVPMTMTRHRQSESEAEGFLTDTIIVALPGVPAELRGIFETSLQPTLRELLGGGASFQQTVIVNCGDESALAEALRNAVANNPNVYVKSRAGKYGDDVRLRVTLQATGPDLSEAKALVEAATRDLTHQLAAFGISIHAIQ